MFMSVFVIGLFFVLAGTIFMVVSFMVICVAFICLCQVHMQILDRFLPNTSMPEEDFSLATEVETITTDIVQNYQYR